MNIFDGAVELLLAILHLLFNIIGGFSSLIGPLGMGSVANIRRSVVLYFRTLDLNVFGLCQSCLDSLDALVVGTLDLHSILLRNSFWGFGYRRFGFLDVSLQLLQHLILNTLLLLDSRRLIVRPLANIFLPRFWLSLDLLNNLRLNSVLNRLF